MNGTSSVNTTSITAYATYAPAKAASRARLLIATSALVGAIALSSSSAMAQATGASDPGAAMVAEREPVDVVEAFMASTAPDRVGAAARRGVVEEATDVSLKFDNPGRKEIEPWADPGKGPQAFSSTFIRVAKYRKIENFTVQDMSGAGKDVVVSRAPTYRPVAPGNAPRSPSSVQAGVKHGKITYLQSREETYASASLFRQSGSWAVKPDPAAPAFSVVRWK